MANALIVDDTRLMRQLLKHILTRASHTVVGEAEDGHSALELYRQAKPDIVLLDVVMPGIDGIETTTRLLAEDPAAKVIMCTAAEHEGLMKMAIESGAKAFIPKPYQRQEVLDVIQEVLGAKGG